MDKYLQTVDKLYLVAYNQIVGPPLQGSYKNSPQVTYKINIFCIKLDS